MKYLRFRFEDKTYWGEFLPEGHKIKALCELERNGPFLPDFEADQCINRLFNEEEVDVVAPVSPGKIIGIGLNYHEHAREFQMELPNEPLFFLKASSALIGPNDNIIIPSVSKRVDYEGELAVIIGRKGKNIPQDRARDFIFGYSCFNDITARDLQKKDGQWSRSKSFDTFAALGPVVSDEVDPLNAEIKVKLNGTIKQKSATADMIFSVDEIVSYLSRMMTLCPGDVIATGTPPGVGKLRNGDQVEVNIAGIGGLINSVIEDTGKEGL